MAGDMVVQLVLILVVSSVRCTLGTTSDAAGIDPYLNEVNVVNYVWP